RLEPFSRPQSCRRQLSLKPSRIQLDAQYWNVRTAFCIEAWPDEIHRARKSRSDVAVQFVEEFDQACGYAISGSPAGLCQHQPCATAVGNEEPRDFGGAVRVALQIGGVLTPTVEARHRAKRLARDGETKPVDRVERFDDVRITPCFENWPE